MMDGWFVDVMDPTVAMVQGGGGRGVMLFLVAPKPSKKLR